MQAFRCEFINGCKLASPLQQLALALSQREATFNPASGQVFDKHQANTLDPSDCDVWENEQNLHGGDLNSPSRSAK